MKSAQGNVLLITLFFLVILSIMVGEALYMTNTQARFASRTGNEYKLFAAADAEMERMYAQWKSLMNQQQLGKFQYPSPDDLYANVINTRYSDMATLLSGSNWGDNGLGGVKINYNPIFPLASGDFDPEKIESVNSLGVPTPVVSGSLGSLDPTQATHSADYPNHPGWQLLNTTYQAQVALYTVDVTGSMNVHIGRTFTQSVIPISQAAIFYDDNLSFHPGSAMSINGPIQTNGALNIQTNDKNNLGFILSLTGDVSQSGASTPVITGNGSTVVSSSNGASVAPYQWSSPMVPVPSDTYESLFSPANWNSTNTALQQNVKDGYRELLDPPANAFSNGVPVSNYDPNSDTNDPRPVSRARFYNQAGLKLVVSKSGSTQVVQAFNANNVPVADINGQLAAAINPAADASGNALKTTIYDYREAAYIEVTNIDLQQFQSFITAYIAAGNAYNGIVYFANTDQSTTQKTAARLINGSQLPTDSSGDGFTFATNSGIYIQGDYNTRLTNSTSGNNPLPSQVLADAVTVLSNSWNDANNYDPLNPVAGQPAAADLVWHRTAQSTTVNTSIVAGIAVNPDKFFKNGAPDPTYFEEGGAHNFIRLMENWTNPDKQTLTFMGSIAQLFHSTVFNGLWTNTSVLKNGAYVYTSPNRVWSYNPDIWNHPPPGTFANIQFVRGQWTRY